MGSIISPAADPEDASPSGRSALVLGTFGFGEALHAREAEVDAICCALDCGINAFDTAPMYADGEAERILGLALSGTARDRVSVITKINPWDANLEKMARECEASLARMSLDYIDLYLLHWRGPVPIDETVEALERLRGQGKIRDWGVSNFDREDLLEILALRRPSLGSLTNQVLYNPRRREAESRLMNGRFPSLELMAYSPFERDRPLDLSVFAPVARRHGCDVHAAVLAWILRQGVRPVFKASRRAHVRENARAIEVDFLTEELEAIERAYPRLEQPARIERDDTV
jgi:diketogulonate reductase-like aldo/keto reductase